MRTKNFFEVGRRSFNPDIESIVFISYRRTVCDRLKAKKCADILESINGLSYWLDENDGCMRHAQVENDDLKTALCIEQGLDVSSALLGIIGPATFTSPWIPYEIGGARGRQRFSKPFDTPPSVPHPMIAHLIHEIDISKVPAFVSLGIPLISEQEVEMWAKSVAEISRSRYVGMTPYNVKSVQNRYGIQDIYKDNSRLLKPTPRF